MSAAGKEHDDVHQQDQHDRGDAEILAASAEGSSTAEGAVRLWLSEGTVRNRVSDIL